jgi:imidazolonepropionase-like amidohydrolase
MGVVHAAATDSVVLENVRLIDGMGGPPQEHAIVVIKGGRIAAVGTATTISVPRGAHVVDLDGKSVLPGLISDHSHLGMVDGTSASAKNATAANIERQLRQFEAYGVTTVTSLGLNGAPFYQLRGPAHQGSLPGADIFGADRGIGVPGGAPPVDAGPDQLYRPHTAAEARQAVREAAARHTDLVKVWVDDFHGSLPVKMKPEIYRAVIDEAHKHGLRVAAHVYYLDDARQLVADGVDILAHGVRDKPVDAAFIAAMKARHTWYIPTLGLDEDFYIFAEQPALLGDPLLAHALQPALRNELANPGWRAGVLAKPAGIAVDKQALAMNQRNLKALFDAGVNIGFGTDSGAMPLRIPGYAEHRELHLMTDAGLTPLQAIDIATHQAASLLRLNDRGVIAPGKLADLLIVDGDPARDIGDVDRIDAVWHRGKEVSHGIGAFLP